MLGSILGLILFLLYINNIPTVSTTLEFLLCAYDSGILHEHSDPKTMRNTINAVMPQITERFQFNKLHINTHKTVGMFYQTENP